MNEELIKRWNEKVKPSDIIFHLGDVVFGGSELWNRIMPQLNGHKILILGNHDEKNFREGYTKYFETISYQLKLSIEKYSIYLNHYPFLCFAGAYRNPKTIQLYGHVHSGPNSFGLDTDRLKNCFSSQYDVGVDNNNFYPISWEEVKQKVL